MGGRIGIRQGPLGEHGSSMAIEHSSHSEPDEYVCMRFDPYSAAVSHLPCVGSVKTENATTRELLHRGKHDTHVHSAVQCCSGFKGTGPAEISVKSFVVNRGSNRGNFETGSSRSCCWNIRSETRVSTLLRFEAQS